jgi:hypothetical protein
MEKAKALVLMDLWPSKTWAGWQSCRLAQEISTCWQNLNLLPSLETSETRAGGFLIFNVHILNHYRGHIVDTHIRGCVCAFLIAMEAEIVVKLATFVRPVIFGMLKWHRATLTNCGCYHNSSSMEM